MRDNPAIRQIALCLDADGPGQTAAEQFQTKYEKLGYTVKIKKPPRGRTGTNTCSSAAGRKKGGMPAKERADKENQASYHQNTEE